MKLTIIQQNDTHGALQSHPEFFWRTGQPEYRETGGLARIAAYVKEAREESEHLLYVDGGDVFHGSGPLLLTRGSVMVELLNRLGLDAMVPGNWDFAYGAGRLAELAKGLQFPVLAANVAPSPDYLSPYVIKEFSGLRVALVGLTYPHTAATMPPSFSEGLSFSLGTEELAGLLPKLRIEEKADIIVLISHMGFPLDAKLASLVPGIDIVLSGHSHDRIERPVQVGETWIVQAGSSASFLGRLDLSIESRKITDLSYKLIPLYAEAHPPDPEMDELISFLRRPFEASLQEEVGSIKTPLHRMTLTEAPMDRLITDSYLHATGADVTFSHGWRYGVPVLPGTLTTGDLYNIIPTNPKLFQMELEGRDILRALENNLEQIFSADAFEQKGGYVLRSSNLSMAFKPYNPAGARIQFLEIGGSPIDLKKRYTVAGGGEQVLKKFQEDRHVLGVDAHTAIRNYLAEHPSGLELDSTKQIHTI
ncbi:bifunctional metallophosphatase/5'-nucleotidase [Exiguobacterium flavidum]|uniref:bifunctional metallophosphatase/5'-nucleotidase n=1 Tax=Exiguobacterium flavidum TaxID=2184695 RepID=UPI000DF731C0|nr:bifunctional UDP-sugar hydrolase/5'-nucleotidase [Exiguobacterium flavidum]